MSGFPTNFTRRGLLVTGAALGVGLATPALAQMAGSTQMEDEVEGNVRHNIMGFRAHSWEPYFSSLRNGVILVDTKSRMLQFWSEDGSVRKVYPTSVPMTDDLTRRGRTEVIQKVEDPSWAPTPSMKKRNPDWPDFIPAGPDNPLGVRALYLSWKYYRIHGTHDTRKIGRQSSNGCIGLYNEDILELYSLAKVGTQVMLI